MKLLNLLVPVSYYNLNPFQSSFAFYIKISHLVCKADYDVNDVILMFLLSTLNIFHTFFSVTIVDFEQVNVS